MDKLEQITERLRQQKPRMADEEAFVNSVMALIDEPRPHITPLWLKVVRTVSSLAATFLIILYVWQQWEVAAVGNASQLSYIEQNAPAITAPEPEAMDRKATIDEIGKYLAEREKRHEMRKHSISHNYARL